MPWPSQLTACFSGGRPEGGQFHCMNEIKGDMGNKSTESHVCPSKAGGDGEVLVFTKAQSDENGL